MCKKAFVFVALQAATAYAQKLDNFKLENNSEVDSILANILTYTTLPQNCIMEPAVTMEDKDIRIQFNAKTFEEKASILEKRAYNPVRHDV